MKFYVDQIEQVKTDVEGQYNEYGSRTIKSDKDAALTFFYKRLSEVSNSPEHVYFDVKITASNGGIIKKDSIGEYIEVEAAE